MTISFDVGEDLEAIVEAVRSFAEDRIRSNLREYEEAGGLSDELKQECHELGLTTLVLSESLGGDDMLDARAAVLCCEELAWGDVGAAVDIPGPRSAGFLVLELGTEEQQQRLLSPFADEESGWKRRGTLAFVEGPFGLDPSAIEATATLAGDTWTVSGSKRYVQSAGEADLTIVLARDTASTAPDPWDRLVLLAVEGQPSGLKAQERNRTLGLHTARYATLDLDAVKVPKGNRLGSGAPGEVFKALRRTVARKMLLDAARLVGCSRAGSEYAIKYAQERQAFGVYLYEHQALAFMMADMATRVEGMRCLVWEGAAALDQGQDAYPLAKRAMSYASEMSVDIASDCVQVLGGHGYIQDHPVEKWMRDARTLGLVDGLVFDADHELLATQG